MNFFSLFNKNIGIDFGTKRIGIAVSDKEGTLAFPHAVLENNEKFFERLRAMVKKEETKHIVVGVPKALSGKTTAMTKQVKEFMRRLKREGFFVEEEDEMFSTKMTKAHARKDMRDASAAALMLQQYIDRSKL